MRSSILAMVFFLSACGSSEKALTCEYLSDPQNCWAQAAGAAAACLPPSEIGVLAVDRASCSFSDGTLIVFDSVLPNDTSLLETFGFSIEVGGTTCARFVDTFANRMELEAGTLSAVSELHAGGAFHLHCGDGTDYVSDFDLLFTCPANTPPTDGFQVTADFVSFSIWSVATPGELFRCEL